MENIINEIQEIADDDSLSEPEKEAEVENLLSEEGLTVEDVHRHLDEEESEEESDFLIDPADVDIDED